MANNPFLTLKQKLNKTLNNLPKKVGVLAVNHFQDNFRKQGFDGKPWKEVKRRLPIGYKTGRRSSKVRYRKGADRTRGILIGKGRLRRDIKLTLVTSDKVVISSSVPYAAVHNLGLKAGRGAGFQMPQRQFMGNTKELTQDIENLITKEISGAFK
ncbi:phage virion morphogenesis protein [Cytophagaceae bacterium DM2B3-1]|uniref:Phage virion morphogenesis protein n=1 Tax=Xanthocytophaga flava TaxID=3048013 RepID=A0ABT7CKE2_9BACT|nr:phage virion morphogenesis protein [Xanthocytophaga flavus]MDJ1494172.1 phage virion morphogenesis protein [Xanthocytophaga flavus]